jgi:hypothetical protein
MQCEFPGELRRRIIRIEQHQKLQLCSCCL